MKKVLAIMLVLALAFAVFSCSRSSTPASPAAAAKSSGLRVASINWTNAHGWRITYEAQIKEVADEYIAKGWISEFQAFCPNMDSALEIQYFMQCVNDGYDIILLNA